MNTIARTLTAGLVAAGATLGLSLAAAAPAFAHDELTGYAIDSNPDTGAPETLTLSYSDDIMAVGTEIRITDADEQPVTEGDPEISGRDVVQRFAENLEEGGYMIAWRVVSSDGHPIEGRLFFNLAADGRPSWIPAEEFEAGTPGPVTDETAGEAPTDTDHATDAEHEHEHETQEAEDAAAPGSGGPGVVTVVAVALGSAAVVAAVIAATVGRRRRAAAMQADVDDARDER